MRRVGEGQEVDWEVSVGVGHRSIGGSRCLLGPRGVPLLGTFLPTILHPFGSICHFGRVLGKGSKVCVPFCSVHFSELLIVRVLQVSKLEKQNAFPLGKLSLKKSLDFAKYFMMVRSGGISDFT